MATKIRGRISVSVYLALFSVIGAAIAAGTAAPDFNIRTIPPGLAEEIEKNPAILNSIGTASWIHLRQVSKQVQDGGFTGISEHKYLALSKQRELFADVTNSPNIPADIKLILEDIIIQYYFLTYYYHFQDPRKQEFEGEHRRFLQDLGAEYRWIEPAGQNYYQHTFLKRLVREHRKSPWGKFYQEVYGRTGFREPPGEGEEYSGEAGAGTDRTRSTTIFRGEIREGGAFDKYFGPGFHFCLEPRPLGWEIVIRYLSGKENIARLTPPFHFVPNPREIEGWHFRNKDNSGPNEPGEKNVNAPGEERGFIFSPEVGRNLQGPAAKSPINEKDIERIRSFGAGLLRILEYRLGNLKTGEQAKFEFMRFEVELSWPAEFAPSE
jgi:hypothetical protein